MERGRERRDYEIGRKGKKEKGKKEKNIEQKGRGKETVEKKR